MCKIGYGTTVQDTRPCQNTGPAPILQLVHLLPSGDRARRRLKPPSALILLCRPHVHGRHGELLVGAVGVVVARAVAAMARPASAHAARVPIGVEPRVGLG
eukprot:scaffold19475_cov148-Isochrysis_galbana.AAC.1